MNVIVRSHLVGNCEHQGIPADRKLRLGGQPVVQQYVVKQYEYRAESLTIHLYYVHGRVTLAMVCLTICNCDSPDTLTQG